MINKRSMSNGISLIMILGCVEIIIGLFSNFDGGLAVISLLASLIGIGVGLFTLFCNNKITLIVTLGFALVSLLTSNIIHGTFVDGNVFDIIYQGLQYLIYIGGVVLSFILKDQVNEEHPGLNKALAMAKGFTLFNIVYAVNSILGQAVLFFAVGVISIPSLIVIAFSIIIIIVGVITLRQEDKFTANYVAAGFFIFSAVIMLLNLLFMSPMGRSSIDEIVPGVFLTYGLSGLFSIGVAIGNIIVSNKAKNAYYYAYYLGNKQPMNPNMINQARPIIQPNGYQSVNNQPQPPINNPQVGQTPVRPTFVNNDQQIDSQFDDRNDWN